MARNRVPRTKIKKRCIMKIDFSDKKRVFKTLEGEVIRQNRFDTLVVLRASELAKRQVLDVREAARILEQNKVVFSELFEGVGKEVTLRMVCIELLNGPATKDDKTLTGEKRYDMFKLSEKIWAGGVVDITAENVALLKQLIADSGYSNLILGQAYRWLECEEDEEEKGKGKV